MKLTTQGLETSPDIQPAWNAHRERLLRGESSFDELLEDLSDIERLAERYRGRIRDVIWIGIGGSSLGPRALIHALRDQMAHASPRFHFLESPDPSSWHWVRDQLSPETTLVVTVSKSGTTFETSALTLLAIEWLSKHFSTSELPIVWITDPEKGAFNALLKRLQHEDRKLEIPPSTGGRFSVFTPVGLFALALSGQNPARFLKGAAFALDAWKPRGEEPSNSPWTKLTAQLFSTEATHSEWVILPYSDRLSEFAAWSVQLLSESLGKSRKGPTILPGIGPQDQHSVLQLLKEGPLNKVVWFLTPALESRTPIPSIADPARESESALSSLHGVTLEELIHIEAHSTAESLHTEGVPTIMVEDLDLSAEGLGRLMMHFCLLTSLYAGFADINPFDQPGVEDSKVRIRAALNNRKT